MKKLILLVAMLAMALIGAVPALAQSTVNGDQGANPPGGDGGSVRGTITDLSGSVVLVEADPSANSGPKGYFTVTDETEIVRLEDDQRVVASFEDLAVGQQVQTAYAGPIAESYPPQGSAESLVILNDGGGTNREATLAFELEVECDPPANATFFGFLPAEGGISARLTDPDGDGVYAGGVNVAKFPPGPAPPGTEPVSLPVQIVQVRGVIKDFGEVKIDGDKTFEATVSFCDDSGDGSGNGGSSGGGKTLPNTGGALPLALGAGALLTTGGLLTRRLTRQLQS
ncbi:MAG TPA: DUF3221 domain-containing protein [Rubrobacteraceae bacterium]|nr:DUF3221 domain-containing protein [Rubrobacteraceae bacterium]